MIEKLELPVVDGIAAPGPLGLFFEPCWFRVPKERSPLYFSALGRASLAFQAMLREALPERYLSDIGRFEDTRMVYPLLAYSASRPFVGQRTDFTYDILNQATMRKFHFSVRQKLPDVLAAVSRRLRAADMADLAKQYRPDHTASIMSTVTKLRVCRRRLESFLMGDNQIVNPLLLLAGSGMLPEKLQKARAIACEKEWLWRLSHVFVHIDCTDLAPALLAAGTEALKAELNKAVQVT